MGRDALVFLCFLGQADCTTNTTNNELLQELRALSRDLDVSDNNKDHGGSPRRDPDSGEELETDGHLQSNVRAALHLGDLRPQVDLQGPGGFFVLIYRRLWRGFEEEH